MPIVLWILVADCCAALFGGGIAGRAPTLFDGFTVGGAGAPCVDVLNQPIGIVASTSAAINQCNRIATRE